MFSLSPDSKVESNQKTDEKSRNSEIIQNFRANFAKKMAENVALEMYQRKRHGDDDKEAEEQKKKMLNFTKKVG